MHKFISMISVLFLVFSMVPSMTYAQTDAGVVTEPATATVVYEQVKPEQTQTWWQLLLKHAIELAFFIITLMASAFVRILGRKYKFEEHTAKINDVLARATGYAEQKTVKFAKLEGKKNDSAQKMAIAVNMATSLAKEYKLPAKGNAWWEDRLESWLGVGKDK